MDKLWVPYAKGMNLGINSVQGINKQENILTERSLIWRSMLKMSAERDLVSSS